MTITTTTARTGWTAQDAHLIVADTVRAEMARRKISGRALGRMTGLTHDYWNNRVAGKVPFDVNDLATVAYHLNVPVSLFTTPLDGPGRDRAPMVECGPAAGHDDVSRADLGLAA